MSLLCNSCFKGIFGRKKQQQLSDTFMTISKSALKMTELNFKPVTHVIFDLDGTLINTMPLAAAALATVACSYTDHSYEYALNEQKQFYGMPISNWARGSWET